MPNHYVGDLLHTMAISGLSRVRTELLQLAVVPAPPPHPVQMHRQLTGHRYFRNLSATTHGEVEELKVSSQVIAQKHPDLVRRMILAGTSAAGGEEVNNVNAVLQNAVAKATAEKKHPKQSLFFTQSHDGQKAAAEFLQRLGTRQQDRDLPATQETIVAQVTAITKWGMAPKPTSLDSIQHPVLVANGDTDVMVPSINSVELARKLPHSELSIFPDAGHGAIFQYHSAFLDQTLRFLQN